MTDGPLTLEQPLEIDDARRAARLLAQQRRDAEEWHQSLIRKAAASEEAYRKARAEAWTDVVGTAAEREAYVDADTATQRKQRDIDAGMVKAAVERLRGLEGERSMLKSLVEWSARMQDPGMPPSRAAEMPVIGGRS
jgi:hypothetical protein